MELLLLGSLTARALLVIVEIEQLVVALTISQNTTGGKRLPTISHVDSKCTLAGDGHVVSIDLGPDDGILVTVGSHDNQLVVSSPGMTVLAGVVGILLERLSLNHLHLVVLELQLHKTVGTDGHLIIVFATRDGFHRIVGIDLSTDVLEIYGCTCIQLLTALHDGGHVTTHTTLLAYGHRQVEVMRT